MIPVVGVVGASARAAVHSLARACFSSWAVDLFADRDLSRVASCSTCTFDDYPVALPRIASSFPPGPVMYTGGLENHPDIIAELAATRELWGHPPAVLERVRDPWQLFPTLATAGFSTPVLVPRGVPCPTTGRWLRKPLCSSAGLGIRFALPGESPSESHYFQEFIEGVPMSAVFCGTTLLGVTEQLVGQPWLHAKPFSYCGSIGPVRVPEDLFHLRIAVVAELGLRELWNLDFMMKDDRSYPVEVNPRYTASVEVLEHATGRAVFDPRLATPRIGAISTVAKAIYYAPHAITFPAVGPWDADLTGTFDPWHLPAFADIPAGGTVIPAGYPVLTMLESGSSPLECRKRLQSRVETLNHLLAGSTT